MTTTTENGTRIEMDTMTRSYVECALWSSTDDDGDPLDDNYSSADIHPDTLQAMADDCKSFWEQAGEMIEASENWHTMGKEVLARAGHDLWLTRNGHGAGFWDGDWPEYGEALTIICKAMGGWYLYVGDDGMVHGCKA